MSERTAWTAGFLILLLAIAVSIAVVDHPVAWLFRGNSFLALGDLAGGGRLLAALSILLSILTGVRLIRGGLPKIGIALYCASIAGLLAYLLNDHVLKPVFGRHTVEQFLNSRYAHDFRFLHGGPGSSFPSGHAALAAGFLTVQSQVYPRSWPLCAAGVLTIDAIMVAGEWHFISDVLAGTLFGAAMAIAVMQPALRSRLEQALGARTAPPALALKPPPP